MFFTCCSYAVHWDEAGCCVPQDVAAVCGEKPRCKMVLCFVVGLLTRVAQVCAGGLVRMVMQQNAVPL